MSELYDLHTFTASLVGLTKDDALARLQARGLTARVVREDRGSVIMTEDHNLARVNLTIVGGLVTVATIG